MFEITIDGKAVAGPFETKTDAVVALIKVEKEYPFATPEIVKLGEWLLSRAEEA